VVDHPVHCPPHGEVPELALVLEDQAVVEPAVLDPALEDGGVLDIEDEPVPPVSSESSPEQVGQLRSLDEDQDGVADILQVLRIEERLSMPRARRASLTWSAPMMVEPLS